jgi:hypothetical protein
LCRRRNVSIRHDRYAAALAAAAVYNTNRGSTDDPLITAFDFVRDEASARKRDRIRDGKRFIRRAIGTMPMSTPLDVLMSKRLSVIADLTVAGYSNAEELFNECWPHLTPTNEDTQ